ncbi:MAG: Rieske (2Fe-2S) protein, partial [Acidimicrobiia bacterium]
TSPTTSAHSPTTTVAPSTQATPTTSPSTTSPPTTTGSPTGQGVALAPADKLAVGQAGYFTDPATGTPAILVRVSQDQFSAHSALCTHAGCMVNYSGSTLDCPCHGAVFDSTTGQVLRGPARRPLAEIPVQLGSDGEIYVDT